VLSISHVTGAVYLTVIVPNVQRMAVQFLARQSRMHYTKRVMCISRLVLELTTDITVVCAIGHKMCYICVHGMSRLFYM
jgi:hypothetical protein